MDSSAAPLRASSPHPHKSDPLIMRHWILPAGLGLCALTVGPSRISAQEVPACTVLELRLKDLVSSFHAKRGDVFRAVLIAPVQQGSNQHGAEDVTTLCMERRDEVF